MPYPGRALLFVGAASLLAAGGRVFARTVAGPTEPPPAARHVALVDEYCVTCHDEDEKEGGLALDSTALQDVSRHPEVWEKVVRKLRARQMPPVGKKHRPDEATYDSVVAHLEASLDRAAATHPNPGRTASLRRLTRTEYQNAVRDLLALYVDADSSSCRRVGYGFDNVTFGDLSRRSSIGTCRPLIDHRCVEPRPFSGATP